MQLSALRTRSPLAIFAPMPEIDQYETIIGLEVHAQLLTRTKLFCGDTTEPGREPNTQTSVISLGHPGTLPRLNREAIVLAVRLGLACHCEIVQHNYFARKNYFYPDLPKGYQISQHTTPVCKNGFLEISTAGATKKIRINRIHIEEDAGKSIHDAKNDISNLDFNRAGMPLLEIVTEPDIRTAEEAYSYVSSLRRLVRHLGVCNGNMEEGSLRCDVNISVRLKGDQKLGTRVEIKNLNSIRFIKKAIEYETKRLIALHQKNEAIVQQTRGFHEDDFSTYAIRSKEDEDDYRYFPEPDLPSFFISGDMIEDIRSRMPPLEEEIRSGLTADYKLSSYDATQLAADSELADLFLKVAAMSSNYKAAANWVLGPVRNHLLAHDMLADEIKIKPSALAALIGMVDEGRTSYGLALQRIFPELLKHPELDLHQYVETNDLFIQTSQDELDELIEKALLKYADKIVEYNKGKKGLISLFVGEVMKLSKGKADAKMVTEKLLEKLKT